jgi:hypothetical protein
VNIDFCIRGWNIDTHTHMSVPPPPPHTLPPLISHSSSEVPALGGARGEGLV